MNSHRSRYATLVFGRPFTGRLALESPFLDTDDQDAPRRKRARPMLVMRRR